MDVYCYVSLFNYHKGSNSSKVVLSCLLNLVSIDFIPLSNSIV